MKTGFETKINYNRLCKTVRERTHPTTGKFSLVFILHFRNLSAVSWCHVPAAYLDTYFKLIRIEETLSMLLNDCVFPVTFQRTIAKQVMFYK